MNILFITSADSIFEPLIPMYVVALAVSKSKLRAFKIVRFFNVRFFNILLNKRSLTNYQIWHYIISIYGIASIISLLVSFSLKNQIH